MLKALAVRKNLRTRAMRRWGIWELSWTGEGVFYIHVLAKMESRNIFDLIMYPFSYYSRIPESGTFPTYFAWAATFVKHWPGLPAAKWPRCAIFNERSYCCLQWGAKIHPTRKTYVPKNSPRPRNLGHCLMILVWKALTRNLSKVWNQRKEGLG